MVQYQTGSMDRVTAAISDPTRRAIIERLAEGSARISELAEPFPMSTHVDV
jgi:DNA-binding transcriptional ArsR family regulator